MNAPPTNISPQLRQEILDANVAEHQKEARYYDLIHTEIFNAYEQARCRETLASCAAGLPADAACLDIGAGTGNITRKLVALGFRNITCVDISPEMLAVLRADLALSEEHVVNKDVDSFLDSNTENFDLITISSVVHHLPDYLATLTRIFQRLSPGGVLLITHEPHARRDESVVVQQLVALLRKIDFLAYAGRYAMLIALGRLAYLRRDCSMSDYHTGVRALDGEKIRAIFQGHEIAYTEYATARFSVFARLLNRLTADNFQMVVRKKS